MKKISSIILTISIISSVALSQVASTTSTANPFSDGTGRQRLSAEEKQTLLEYADNARAILTQARDTASGMTVTDKKEIYLNAIIKVVMDSFKDKKREELILRQALNQSLELTVGVPSASGEITPGTGILKSAKYDGLVVTILENSISIALKYFTDDRAAIMKQDLAQMPLMQFAQMRLRSAITWNASVIDMPTSHKFMSAVLQQWLNTAIHPNNLLKVTFAEEITGAEAALDQLEAAPIQSYPHLLMQQVRFLRSKLAILSRDAGQKLGM